MANPYGNPTIGETRTLAYDPQHVADALADSFGVVSIAAKKLGCTAATIRRYVHNHAICRDAQVEGRQLLADQAEISLIRKVREEEQWAVRMALHAHASDRGYVPEAGMVAAETARAVIEAVGALVRLHVRDRATLVAIFTGINELAGQEVMSVPQIDGDTIDAGSTPLQAREVVPDDGDGGPE